MPRQFESRYATDANLYQNTWVDRIIEDEARAAYLDAHEETEDYDAETYEWN